MELQEALRGTAESSSVALRKQSQGGPESRDGLSGLLENSGNFNTFIILCKADPGKVVKYTDA